MSVVVGIGLSSRATAEEVAGLVAGLLADAGRTIGDVELVATRARFVDDPRLALGPPVVGLADEVLVAASEPPDRAVGIPARVAETAAQLGAGGRATSRRVARSAHVVVALVETAQARRRRSR